MLNFIRHTNNLQVTLYKCLIFDLKKMSYSHAFQHPKNQQFQISKIIIFKSQKN